MTRETAERPENIVFATDGQVVHVSPARVVMPAICTIRRGLITGQCGLSRMLEPLAVPPAVPTHLLNRSDSLDLFGGLPLLWPAMSDGDSIPIFRALLPAVTAFLQQRGHACNVPRLSLPLLPRPHLHSRLGVPATNRALIEVVRTHANGIFRYRPAERLSRATMLLEIIAAFPNAAIAVVAATHNEVSEIMNELRRRYYENAPALATRCISPRRDEVGTVADITDDMTSGENGFLCRVLVGHYHDMQEPASEWERRHIVIAWDVRKAIAHFPSFVLSRASCARLFGFWRDDNPLSPRERDWVQAIFGFRVFDVLSAAMCGRPVCTEIVPMRHRHVRGNVTDVLDVKRRLIWRNHIRNRHIERLARAVAAGDTAGLARALPSRAVAAIMRLSSRKCTVLVENVEHAHYLRRLIRDWPLVAGENTAFQVGDDNCGVARVNSPPGCQIVTFSAAQGASCGNVDVVIRADAGEGQLPEQFRRFWAIAEAPEPVILIDFADEVHPFLHRRTERRIDMYRDSGWFPVGRDPEEIEVSRFLGRRPRLD